MFFTLAARIRATVSSLGTLDAALYGVDRVLRPMTGGWCRLTSYLLVAQPVPPPPHRHIPPNSAFTFRKIDTDEIRSLRFPRPQEAIERRLDQDCMCFAAFREDELIAFVWLITSDYLEDEVRCRFRPVPIERCAWDFDVYVDPGYRLGRTFARLWQTAHTWLHEQGIQWTMSRISSFNTNSIASHRRLGAQFVGRALFLQAGKVQIACSSLGPLFHVSRDSVPLISVPAPRACSHS